jgi:predicted RND superfamily exporter protein
MRQPIYSPDRLGRSQTSHPRVYLAVVLVVTVVAGFLASRLTFDSSYEALLPEGAPEVENADNVRNQTGGTRQIVLAISGGATDDHVVFGRKLRAKLLKIKEISSVYLEFDVDFIKDRALWLLDTETLDDLIPALEEAVKIAKWQANPMHLHLDEEEERRELEAAWEKVDQVLDKKGEKLPFERVLTSADGKYTFMLVTPTIKFSDMQAGRALLDTIKAEADSLATEFAQIAVRTAGNLDMVQEQHRTMRKDLTTASVLALTFGILIVTIFTRRIAAPFVIGIPLICGVVWTFAAASLLIGHVNIITGFLVAVLIGLGIDFGVHLFVRFQQERTMGGKGLEEAVQAAVSGTLTPALVSALTTSGTFFSFVIADFRGFSEFGLIAGIGVLMTLASSFLVLPPLILIIGRGGEKPEPVRRRSSPLKIDRRAAVAITVVIGLSALFGVYHVSDIPFRNNYRLLRGQSEATDFLDYVNENLGIGINPAVFLTHNQKDALRTGEIIRTHQAQTADPEASLIGSHLSIGDLLPKNIEAHRPRIERLREILTDPKLDRAENKEGERADQLKQARRMVKTEPWSIGEVPQVFRSHLMTKDALGYISYIWPRTPNDADYQATAWETEINRISDKLDAAGIVHENADETLILAWIYRLIQADGIPLLSLAAAVVLLLLALDFRSVRRTALVAFPLIVGMGLFACIVHLWKLELNMFNLIVVPSLIGIGIDNAVHIYHRYREEGVGSAAIVMRTTGVAALLASLTTAVGFGSSLVSHHLGLKSMGLLAIIGISATFIASTIFFPCLLTLLEKRNKERVR